MRKIRVFSTLTVYYDGQFWVGVFECAEDGKLSVSRVVFGAEPSNEEIQELICKRYNGLSFSSPVVLESSVPKLAVNPKRRQRETARVLKQRGPSTKAQQALSEEREAFARQHKADSRKQREQEKQERFKQRQEKRKQKRRGH